jgi:alpha-L-fucosidase 2
VYEEDLDARKSGKKGNELGEGPLKRAFPLALLMTLLFLAGLVPGVTGATGKEGRAVTGELSDWTDLKLWYRHPAATWAEALPVGNGRLGAMVFGRADEERIQLNEETYWSGGPYSQTVKGGAAALPEIQRLIFEGDYIKAHRLFGRRPMGYPVEQQKYQSLGNLILKFAPRGEVRDYRLELDLDTAVATVSYARQDVRYTREVFSSPVDQVIAVRLKADPPGNIGFEAELRAAQRGHYYALYFQWTGPAMTANPDGQVGRLLGR